MLRAVGLKKAAPKVATTTVVPSRTMATEKQLKTRLAAVANIKKITNAMKMVASARVRKTQDTLDQARDYVKAMNTAWPDPKPEDVAHAAGDKPKRALVLFTTDKGLCGSVNSAIIKNVKAQYSRATAEFAANPPALITFGEKAFTGLDRLAGTHFMLNLSDNKTKMLNWKQAARFAQMIIDLGLDQAVVYHNHFKSMMSFETKQVPIYSYDLTMKDTKSLEAYDIEGGNEFFENFYAFRLATRIFYWIAETECVEMSQRLTAMSGSVKSANEMAQKLQLMYNRRRQGRITTELSEIVSGAISVDDAIANE